MKIVPLSPPRSASAICSALSLLLLTLACPCLLAQPANKGYQNIQDNVPSHALPTVNANLAGLRPFTPTPEPPAPEANLQVIQDTVRMRAAEFIDAKFDRGPPAVLTNRSSVSDGLEYVLAALHKNSDAATVAAANGLLVDILNFTSWTDPQETPTAAVGIYFEIPMVLELWYLFNSQSERFPGRLTTGSGGSEPALKAWFYNTLRRSKEVSADDASLSNLWTIIDSENHDVIRKGTVFLMASALRSDPAYQNLLVRDGLTTVEETSVLWENYFIRWFNARVRKGLLVEMASPTYFKYTSAMVYLLRDYAPNPTIRSHADQFLTLLFADYALEYSQGTRAGAKTRTYMDEAYNINGQQDSIYRYSKLYYNYGSETSYGPFNASYVYWPAVVSDYRVPLEVMDLALRGAAKGSYAYTSTRPAYEPVRRPGFYNIQFPNYLNRYSYVTPDYINGVFTVDPTLRYARINTQNRWMGVMFTSHTDSRATLLTNGTAQGGQTAYDGLNGVGWRDAMVLQVPSFASDSHGARVFLSSDLLINAVDEDGWLFTRDVSGAGYLAIKPARGAINAWNDVTRNPSPPGNMIRNGADADTNFAGGSTLRVKNSATDGSMVYFQVTHPGDAPLLSATLRLYADAVTDGGSGSPVVKVYGLTNDNFSLNGMTWSSGSPNHAEHGYRVMGAGETAMLVATTTISAAGSYYDIDVTSFANAQIAQPEWQKGDNVMSFLIVGERPDGSEVTFTSNRASTNRPALKLVVGRYGNLSDGTSPVVFQTGRSADYPDLGGFMTAVKSGTSFAWNGSAFTYQNPAGDTLTYDTGSALPQVNGVPVELRPAKTYDSPFLSADYDRPVATVTATTGDQLVLDFSLDFAQLAEWRFDEGTGTAAADASGNGFDGTVAGATWTTGVKAGALSFDGSGQLVELPTSTGLSTAVGSVSLWVKYTASDGMLFYGAPVSNGDGFGSADEFHVHTNGVNGKIGFFIRGNPNVSLFSAAAYNDGRWHHVAATWQVGGDATLYVDGVAVASAPHTGNAFSFTSLMRIGAPGVNTIRALNGQVDQVKLFGSLLTSADVGELALEGSPSPLGWWKLDENAGTTAADSSGNSLNGVVVNATWTNGYADSALRFNGTGTYVELPTSTSLSSTAGSVSLWFKAPPVSAPGIMFYGSPETNGDGFGSQNELHLHLLGNGRLGFYVRGSTNVNISGPAAVDDNQWHHAAATWDVNGNAVLYLDGVAVATAAHDANVFPFSASMRIGAPKLPAVRAFVGDLDQVRVFDGPLTAGQISALARE